MENDDYCPKLALIEAETRHRLLTADEPAKLEAILSDELEQILKLKERIDKDVSGIKSKKAEISNYRREAQFYQHKINQLNRVKLEVDQETIRQMKDELDMKREELKRLAKCLEEFAGMEPTDEDLKRRIDELKSSRMNLEMTFVGDSP